MPGWSSCRRPTRPDPAALPRTPAGLRGAAWRRKPADEGGEAATVLALCCSSQADGPATLVLGPASLGTHAHGPRCPANSQASLDKHANPSLDAPGTLPSRDCSAAIAPAASTAPASPAPAKHTQTRRVRSIGESQASGRSIALPTPSRAPRTTPAPSARCAYAEAAPTRQGCCWRGIATRLLMGARTRQPAAAAAGPGRLPRGQTADESAMSDQPGVTSRECSARSPSIPDTAGAPRSPSGRRAPPPPGGPATHTCWYIEAYNSVKEGACEAPPFPIESGWGGEVVNRGLPGAHNTP